MNGIKPQDAKQFIGTETGLSDWILIDQERINQFAEVTEDRQAIHIDPETAKTTPFGGAVAHGFLTLSMLAKMAAEGVLFLEGHKMGVNYGFDKVRLMSPVRAGKRIRGRFKLLSVDQRAPGQWSFKYAVRVEIEGEDKPALLAEWLSMQYV